MNNTKNWTNNIDRMEFRLSDISPICALHHKWNQAQPAHHDMHYGLELGILLSGKMRRFNRNFRQDLTEGNVWLCGMWEPHGYQITGKNTQAIVLIIFPPVLARTQLDQAHPIRWLAPFEAPPENRPQVNRKTKSRLIKLAAELAGLSNNPSKHTGAWLRIKLYEILLILMENWKTPADITPQTSDELAIVNKAVELVFTSANGITTQQAAAACSINRNSFAKLFSQIMGIRFSEFDLRFRITQAANLLRGTKTPIKKIAVDCGFADVPHLHRNFQKYYNKTPKEFRNHPPYQPKPL